MRTFNLFLLFFLFHGFLVSGLLAGEKGGTPTSIQAKTKADAKDDPDVDTILCPGSKTIRIDADEICNGKVDCPGATDEMGCSCRTRINPLRLCDNVFDCPSIEDELGCPGCGENQLKCDKSRTKSLCISLHQRCDAVKDCPNGMDEAVCTTLSPSQTPMNISVPKYNSGYIMRNFKNIWYPLCSPDISKANSSSLMELTVGICQLTVGSASGNIHISNPKLNPTAYKGKFAAMTGVKTKPFKLVDQCPTSKLVLVTCPQPNCGRKAPSLQEASLKANSKSVAVNNAISESIQHPQPYSDTSSWANLDNPSLQPVNQERIVGGKSSSQGAWPWIIQILKYGEPFCGATLLTNRWMLTAGHCFHSFKDHHYQVQLGMLRHSSFSPFEQTRTVAAVFVHPHYDRVNLHNDITLLLVQKPFDLNQWSAPACLPSPKYNPALGTNCTIVGWGYTAENGLESDVLREVILPLTTCTMKTKVNLKSIMCAGIPKKGGKDSCQGDSGGPMVCQDPTNSKKWILAGVVSFGVGCARPGQVGAYTRVTYHLDWINQTMKTSTLPKVVPKQGCSGMVCRLGSGVCLDKDSICDDKVDCLNAEDEVGCPRPSLV